MVLESAGKKAEIHYARRCGKTQAVGGDQALISIGTLHEFVAETSAPLRRVGRGLRDRLKMQTARVLASDLNGERIVEAERRAERQMESPLIFRADAIVNRF